MTGTLRWHSCSTTDFPLKRHKVSKACEACRGKKMRCDGHNPCQRCESNKMKCIYNDKPARSRSIVKKTVQTSNSSSSSLTLSPPSSQQSIATKELPISCLNKITFVNELYESLRLQQWPKSRRYGTSIPPLLFDFFNITSQPQTIWSYFTLCLNKIFNNQGISDNFDFLRDASEEESSQLVKEAFQVFISHNLLYGSFIDTPLLLFVLSSVSMFPYMQQSSIQTKELPFPESSLPFYSIIIYCILAITFQSAYQSLPNLNQHITDSLYTYSHLFYREAHKMFLNLCFPTTPSDPTNQQAERKKHIIILVQASVLLTHFQSIAISEQQAFMTLKIGLNLTQQANLTTIDDDETILALLKSLDAWYVWLCFYLQRPYSSLELDLIPITEYHVMFARKTKEQRWAIYLTDTYTFFLKNLLKKKKSTQPLNINTIKDSLNSLITSNEMEQNYFPNQIIQLYHDILTIQLYTSQLDNNLSSIGDDTLDSNDNTTLEILNICISSSQNILSKVNKVIFTEYNNSTLKYIPLSIIYSTCLVSQITLFFLKNKKSCFTTIIQKEMDSLHSNLVKILKTASPYFEPFQILYSKFNLTPKRVDINKTSTISPSPTSLSTSSSTTTTTNPLQVSTVPDVVINPLASEPQAFLSIQNNHNDLLIASDTQHMTMNLPMTGGITSRADIDREQLEKLSHHYHHHQNHQLLQQQQILLQKQQLNQFQFQQPNSYCLSKYMPKRSMNNDQYYYYKNGQKRAYQLYNQFDYNLTQPMKRQRSNTAISYDLYSTKSDTMGHERSKSVATEFIDLETNNENFMYDIWMLDGTPTEEIYDVRKQPYFLPPQDNNITKLPLPQPSKQPSVSKTWLTSQAQTSSKIFFDSEVQTLHYQTPPLVHFEPSFPILNVIGEETNTNLMYPNHRASIVSDHSTGGSSHSGNYTSNVVSSEETVAAAVAVWASSSREEKSLYQQGTSNNSVHWINSEKVGEEEYWVE